MRDNLRTYVEEQVGFLEDNDYYSAIKQLSDEFVTYEMHKDLQLYALTHREDFLSEDAYDYVKNRISLFKQFKETEETWQKK